MDEFSYLSVLMGLILGLGITKLMEGMGHLFQARETISWYWPVKLWIGTLLLFHIQAWWAMYELRHIPQWTFLSFLVVLIQPVLLFLLSALALPDARESLHIDLEKTFHAHALISFRIATMMVLSSVLKEYWLYHRMPYGQNLIFHGAFTSLFLIGSVKSLTFLSRWIVASVALLLLLYIALLFSTLT